ncbi:MAG: DEAD/DEAH box helicase [Bacteroidia bacterium]|nr:DEAD/DEAH box helicase [Bacteroidia bacterium]
MKTTFSALGLIPEILEAISELGFEYPTPIQEQAIPYLLQSHNDLIAFAQTGTGKTAAFGLPVVQQLDPKNINPQVLILCPTRELCLQICRDLTQFAAKLPQIRVVSVYGGAPIEHQIAELRRGAQVVVGTPGRVLDLLNRRRLDISNIQWLVLDEADEMLSMGFKDDLDAILSTTPEEKQTLLFSATMPPEMISISEKYMHNPVEISTGKRNTGADNVLHHYYMVHAQDRYLALKRIVDFYPAIFGIVFCRTRQETKDVADKLMQDGYNADALHGDLSQAQRDYVMGRFRNHQLQILVATDVAARGLDVNSLTHVINYNLPDDPEVYIHRSGRTGRAGKSGISISVIHMRERFRIQELERKINKRFEQQRVPSGRDICETQLFHLIDNIGKTEVSEVEIAPFLPVIYEKLEWLSREELIKRFVSAEFNHFLAYYKNAPDLNVEVTPRKSSYNRRDDQPQNGNGQGYVNGNGNGFNRSFAKIAISVGKRDNMTPKTIILLLNSSMPGRSVKIGQIDIQKNHSVVEVEDRHQHKVLEALRQTSYRGRRLSVETV